MNDLMNDLSIRYETEEGVSKLIHISNDNVEAIQHFIQWALDYNYAYMDENGNMECETLRSFLVCQRKLLHMGLLPQIIRIPA